MSCGDTISNKVMHDLTFIESVVLNISRVVASNFRSASEISLNLVPNVCCEDKHVLLPDF